MTREIKFRAWDSKVKKMYQDIPLKTLDNLDFGKGMVNTALKEIQLNDFILMQFTGLKDKNGKEIYEGDIVRIYSKNHKWCGIRQVEWDEYRALFKPTRIRYADTNETEIIGNIYENPELCPNNSTSSFVS